MSGSAGTSGAGGSGEPCTEEGATRSCCREGIQVCLAGEWSLCDGAYLSNESCNGIDDDCDGEVDELGTFSCGIGACTRTISACDGGVLGVCLPAAPAATTDGCNDIDDDCDGAVDEDCPACVRVATTGDDAAAAANGGATPFATVQAAIDFADAHPSVPRRVCVAAGPACFWTATFAGPTGADLTMKNGISVLANYESGGWTRCADSETHLAPQTGRGVVFPANVSTLTVLDGFAIDRFAAETTAGVTVDGGRDVLLSNIAVIGGPVATNSYGVNVINGGQATVFHSRIDNGGSDLVGIALRAVGSELIVEDSCPTPPDPTTGRCVPPCLARDTYGRCSSVCSETSSGIQATSRTAEFGRSGQQIHAVVLEDSPGSRIERSAICTTVDPTGVFGEGTAVRLSGDASGTVVRANAIRLDNLGFPYAGPLTRKAAIRLSACRGAAPWLVANESIEASGAIDVEGVIASVGDCHPVIEGNARIEGKTADVSSAIQCSDGSDAPSRCVVTNNELIQNQTLVSQYVPPNGYYAIGVNCVGRSCARIDGSRVVGITGSVGSRLTRVSGTGIVTGGATIVADNDVTGSCSSQFRNDGVGISASAARGLMENNEVLGSCDPSSDPWFGGRENSIAYGLRVASSGAHEWIVRSNTIRPIGSACGLGPCGPPGFPTGAFRAPPAAVSFTGTTGVFRDNVLSPGSCHFAFFEAGTGEQHPRLFEDNHFTVGVEPWSPLYHDTVAGDLHSPAEIDALTDMTASGTTAGICQ